MAGLEDLARGLQRFRRTPEKTNDAYLEPMRQSLLALSSAKRDAEEAAGKPEHYRIRPERDIYVSHQLVGKGSINVEDVKKWLDELRGHRLSLSPMDAQAAEKLRQIGAELLLHFYKLPQCGYIRQAYPELALMVEEEANAVAATVKDAEIRRIVPFLLFLAQCNVSSLDVLATGTLAQYGVPLSAMAPKRLEALVNEFVTGEVGERHYARIAHTADDVTQHHSGIITRLGIRKEGISPANTFLISSQGAPQGFLMLHNESGAHSPLYAIAHLKDKPAAAIRRVVERFAAHLGYSAVKLLTLLDEGTSKDVSAAGLFLLGLQGFSKDTSAGLFADMLGSDDAQKRIYGAFSRVRLEFRAEQFQESSRAGSVIKTATFTDLAAAEFFNHERRRLPDEKIQSLIFRTSGQGGTVNYVFSFGETSADKLVYVIRVNEKGSNGSLEEAVAAATAAANEVAKFFDGAVKRIGPEEMYGKETPSEKAGGFGIFYCAHTEGLPNAAVRVRANFSIRKALRFVNSMAEAAGYGQAQIDVRYCNLSPGELAAITRILPIGKMSAVKEVTSHGFKAEEFKNETLPSYIDGAVIYALSANPESSLFAAHWQFDYDSSSGSPRVTVTPATPGLHTGNNSFERELLRVVYALFEDHAERGLVPRIGGLLHFPEISDGSALIRLAVLPGPSVLKEVFDALFPDNYFVRELRYRSRVQGEELAQA